MNIRHIHLLTTLVIKHVQLLTTMDIKRYVDVNRLRRVSRYVDNVSDGLECVVCNTRALGLL